jgi:hypothetical protein
VAVDLVEALAAHEVEDKTAKKLIIIYKKRKKIRKNH